MGKHKGSRMDGLTQKGIEWMSKHRNRVDEELQRDRMYGETQK